jgi:hypothetical protein
MAAAILGVAAALSGGCGGADDQISSTPGSTSAPAPRHTAAPVKVSENLAAVCPQLARRTRALIDGIASRPPGRLTIHPTRSLHLTACRFDADDAEAHLTLDVAPDARQRYSNRMVESYQFGSGAGATSPFGLVRSRASAIPRSRVAAPTGCRSTTNCCLYGALAC